MLAAIAITILAMFAACKKYDDTDVVNRIDDLEDRVTTLEQVTAELKARLDAGSLVKSVTAITEYPGGWRIDFTSGSPSYVDIFNGEDSEGNPNPVTPQFEVRDSESDDGTLTLWVDYGDGWEDTGAVISDTETIPDEGEPGAQGEPGPQGEQGADGVSPMIDVRKNDDDTVSVWYNNTHTDGEGGTWEDTGFDISTIGPVLSIVGNDSDGTVTITMNDDDETEYTFFRASTAVRFEIMTLETVAIEEGGTGEVPFVVNPSTAWIPTDDLTKWELNGVDTRAGYVTADGTFTIASIEQSPDGEGEYIATIKCSADGYDTAANDEHTVALVYNAGTAEQPKLISSGPFVLQVKQIARRITWDSADGRYVLTTDPTDAGLYFVFGSVAGIYSGNGANATLPADGSDTFDPGDVAWSPVAITGNGNFGWMNIPIYTSDDYPAKIDAAYHTIANVKAGRGDPCRLVGLDLNKIAATEAGSLTAADIDNGTWRLPTNAKNKSFSGYGAPTYTDDYRATLNGVSGGMFPDASGGADKFLPAAGWRAFGTAGDYDARGAYYSSEPHNSGGGYVLHFDASTADPATNLYTFYNYGLSVRCVRQ